MAYLTPNLVRLITSDESLFRGLDEPFIRVLVEWIESECELFREKVAGQSVEDRARDLLKHARGLARFAQMWNNPATRSGAIQLWATQKWGFDLPNGPIHLMDLLQRAMSWSPPVEHPPAVTLRLQDRNLLKYLETSEVGKSRLGLRAA